MNNNKTFCELCNHMELNNSDYVKHLSSKHHLRRVSDDYQQPKIFNCIECNFHTLDESKLIQHTLLRSHIIKTTKQKQDLTAQAKYRKRKQEERRQEKADEKLWMITPDRPGTMADDSINKGCKYEGGHIWGIDRHCKCCNITTLRDSEMIKHLETNKHKRNVILQSTQKSTTQTYCDVCDITCPGVMYYIKHCDTAKHAKHVFMKDNIITKNEKLFCIPCDTSFVSKRMCNEHMRINHRCESSDTTSSKSDTEIIIDDPITKVVLDHAKLKDQLTSSTVSLKQLRKHLVKLNKDDNTITKLPDALQIDADKHKHIIQTYPDVIAKMETEYPYLLNGDYCDKILYPE